jgi:hypothetical protein
MSNFCVSKMISSLSKISSSIFYDHRSMCMCMDFLLKICGFLKLPKMEENTPTLLAKFQ